MNFVAILGHKWDYNLYQSNQPRESTLRWPAEHARHRSRTPRAAGFRPIRHRIRQETKIYFFEKGYFAREMIFWVIFCFFGEARELRSARIVFSLAWVITPRLRSFPIAALTLVWSSKLEQFSESSSDGIFENSETISVRARKYPLMEHGGVPFLHGDIEFNPSAVAYPLWERWDSRKRSGQNW